jgi:uncharacterized membrane protein
LVFSAPANIVMSRFASDRMYEERADQIAPPLRRLLAVLVIGGLVLGAGAMVISRVGASLGYPGAALTAVVAGQWLLLSAAGGLAEPGAILRAFAIGGAASVIGALGLGRPDAFGSAGYLYGFAVGQVTTLALLLWGTMRALPEEEDESAQIRPAFGAYWLLGVGAICLNAGIWVDKLVVYLAHGGAAASTYAALAALAWLSVVPSCAYLFVQVETTIYRRFRGYFAAVSKGTLAELRQASNAVEDEVNRTIRGTAAVQVTISVVCWLLTPLVVERLGLPSYWVIVGRVLLVGAAIQVVALCAVLLLHYFDFQLEALAAAATLLVVNTAGTAILAATDWPLGVGYTVACIAAATLAFLLLRSRLSSLLRDTFQAQPYGAEG